MRTFLILLAGITLSTSAIGEEHRMSVAVRDHQELDRIVRHVE